MTLNVYMTQHLRNVNFEWHNFYVAQPLHDTTFEKCNVPVTKISEMQNHTAQNLRDATLLWNKISEKQSLY